MANTGSDAMARVVLSLCEAVDTPRALSAWLCFKYNQDALLELPSADFADNDTSKVAAEYFLSEYVSKYKGLKVSVDPEKVALSRWMAAEQQCLEVNQRFRSYAKRPFDGRAERVLFGTQRLISRILGELDLARVLADCKLGPGATFDIPRRYATPDRKYTQPISVTTGALPYFRRVLESDPHWAYCFTGVMPDGPFRLLPSVFSIVRGSRFLTVPKSAKTDRCIAAEPTANQFLQQGVHSYMTKRLKRFGIDLSSQEKNQVAARDAYARRFSTLDLSAASDTISRELVFHLLPIDWAMFLDALRSPETLMGNGSWMRTEKFASMGNAFCFDLETIIFFALARTVNDLFGNVGDDVLVYGDDIIVSEVVAEDLIYYLSFCGFSVNSKKSYIRGNFFESCGKHYHRQVDITPAYQKEILDHPSEIIRAHNRLFRYGLRNPQNMLLVKGALRILRGYYPKEWPFPRIPVGVSEDGGFLCPVSQFQLDRNHGYRCRVLDYVPGLRRGHDGALYAYKLRRFHRHKLRGDVFLGDAYNTPTNPDPRGWASVSTEGKWRTRVRWIPEMAVPREGDGG